MSRSKRGLVERIVDGSFRPVRHAHLLMNDDVLPEMPPAKFEHPARHAAWLELRSLQIGYRGWTDDGELDIAFEYLTMFAQMVRYLHGNRRPKHYDWDAENFCLDRVDELTGGAATAAGLGNDVPPEVLGRRRVRAQAS
jgi:hypothetical protein